MSKKADSLDKVMEAIRSYYKQNIKDKDPNDIAMLSYTPVTEQRKKKFGKKPTGNCNNCGKKGHYEQHCWLEGGGAYDPSKPKMKFEARAATDQPTKQEVQNAMSKVKCFLCGKFGHKAADCK